MHGVWRMTPEVWETLLAPERAGGRLGSSGVRVAVAHWGGDGDRGEDGGGLCLEGPRLGLRVVPAIGEPCPGSEECACAGDEGGGGGHLDAE